MERAVSRDCTPQFDVEDQTGGNVDALPETTRIAIFRICQEAINNAVLHSGATHISVVASCQDPRGDLKIEICDNGQFQTRTGKPGSGFAHMKTRAHLIGAKFEHSTEDGTRITVKLPQTAQEAERAEHEDFAG